jgi:hypothetical protein
MQMGEGFGGGGGGMGGDGAFGFGADWAPEEWRFSSFLPSVQPSFCPSFLLSYPSFLPSFHLSHPSFLPFLFPFSSTVIFPRSFLSSFLFF